MTTCSVPPTDKRHCGGGRMRAMACPGSERTVRVVSRRMEQREHCKGKTEHRDGCASSDETKSERREKISSAPTLRQLARKRAHTRSKLECCIVIFVIFVVAAVAVPSRFVRIAVSLPKNERTRQTDDEQHQNHHHQQKAH